MAPLRPRACWPRSRSTPLASQQRGSFPLLLTGTLNGNTDFGFQTAKVLNGLISILPPPPKGSISGNVFNDKNRDGKREKGEAGLAGWTVDIDQMVNGKEVVVATALTDKNGNYDAKGLKAGIYDVEVVAQPAKATPTGKSVTGYHVSTSGRGARTSPAIVSVRSRLLDRGGIEC